MASDCVTYQKEICCVCVAPYRLKSLHLGKRKALDNLNAFICNKCALIQSMNIIWVPYIHVTAELNYNSWTLF